ncbi:hypothetical protein L0F63_003478 [Massospora cicadina]|nr:hypothetical protein L0F63_003478 [Massospora cicadina]
MPNAPIKEANTVSLIKATSDDSIHLIEKRMDHWRDVVRDLLLFFEENVSIESSTGKGLEKAAGCLPHQPKESLMIEEEQLGVMHLVKAMRDHSTLLSHHHHETSQSLTAETLHELKLLRDAIKEKAKSIKKEYSGLNSKLTKSYDASINSNKEVAQALSEFRGENPDPSKDPWLVNREMLHKRHQSVNEENNIARSVELSMKSYESFESGVVQRIKLILDRHYTRVEQAANTGSRHASHLKKLIGGLADDAEWTSFQNKHPDVLTTHIKDPRSTDSEKSIEHAVLEAAKEGHVSRRSGVGPFKSWKNCFAVITNSGFLHGFQSSDHALSPEFSIPLAHARVEPHHMDKESPYTFEVMDYSQGGVFSSEKTYTLRAESQKDFDEWIHALLVWAKTSPVSSANASYTSSTFDFTSQNPSVNSATNPAVGQSGSHTHNPPIADSDRQVNPPVERSTLFASSAGEHISSQGRNPNLDSTHNPPFGRSNAESLEGKQSSTGNHKPAYISSHENPPVEGATNLAFSTGEKHLSHGHNSHIDSNGNHSINSTSHFASSTGETGSYHANNPPNLDSAHVIPPVNSASRGVSAGEGSSREPKPPALDSAHHAYLPDSYSHNTSDAEPSKSQINSTIPASNEADGKVSADSLPAGPRVGSQL